MLSSRHALCTALFCLASATAPVTSHAAEWRVVSFDVDLLSLDEASSAGPLQHAKLSGTAVELGGEQHRALIQQLGQEVRDAWLFRLELAEDVLTEVGDDRSLIIKRWRPVDGVTAFKRDG